MAEKSDRAGEIYRAEIEFGWKSLQDFGTFKSLFNSPEYLEGLDFNAMLAKAKNQSRGPY